MGWALARAGSMWVVIASVSEVDQALVVESCVIMRMTEIRSGVPAVLYQAC